jgi:MOSC domain-containing protein YiiM
MPSLLSVNVGMPQNVAWQGRTVFTSVWKHPVPGPRVVRRLNIDGDGQGDLAGHGGEHRAVFVYQIDSYRYWQRQLRRDNFTYGQFGENLSCRSRARLRYESHSVNSPVLGDMRSDAAFTSGTGAVSPCYSIFIAS